MNDPLLDTVVAGKYRVIRKIGEGGMSFVYEVQHVKLLRSFALKGLLPQFAFNPEAAQRFEREAELLGSLRHPNVIDISDWVYLPDGTPCMVLEFLHGASLQTRLQRGPLQFDAIARLADHTCSALALAHRNGITHRDVKPENIFLDDVSGRAMLSDFGVARVMDAPTELTATGTTIGTPTYMAPEQIDGVQLDGRSDLYSLGMVGWEMLTGERPWAGESLYSVIYRQKHDPLTPIDSFRDDVPPRLQYLVEGLMPKNPDRRWASAARFLTLLASEQALPGFREWESAQRRRRRSRVFRQARQRGTSVIGAALETVKFARPPTPVAGLSTDAVKGAKPSTPDEPIAGEQPGVPVETEAATMRLPTPARGTPRGTPSIKPTPARRTPGGVVHSGGYSIKRTPGEPGTFSSGRGVVTIPEPRPSRVGRVVLALALAAAGGGYWYFNLGPGSQEPAQLIGYTAVPQDQAGIELPIVTTADTVPPTSADSGVPAAAAAPGALASGTPAAPPAGTTQQRPTPPAADPATTTARDSAVNAQPLAVTPPPLPETVVPNVPTLAFLTDRGNISAGVRHSCMLDNDGHALCWGSNDEGQVGDGSYEMRSSPARVAGNFVFSQVTAGYAHSCGLTIANEVFCWGGNAAGQLGDGTTSSRTAPVRLNSSVSFKQIRAGRDHTCGLSNSGSVFCWGANADGQLGDRSRQARATPATVDVSAGVAALAVGWHHSCALTGDGTAWCWGRNESGQLGDGTTTSRSAPVKVQLDVPLVSIAAGSSHSCGVSSSGRAYCWGRSVYGQVGAGTLAETVPVPREVASHPPLVTIVAGLSHTCARAQDGSGWCWGRNIFGQLGDGTTVDRSTPVRIRSVARLAAVNAGGSHTCATGLGGEAWCWGGNRDGQVGRGDRENATTPVRLAPPR